MNGLTRKQTAFVDAYVGTARGNATLAAKLAGYSEASAYQLGHATLKNLEVRAEIDRRLVGQRRSAGEVLELICRVAFLDARSYVRRGEKGVPEFDWDKAEKDGVLDLIQEIIPMEHGVRIKFPPRLEAAALLAKFHGVLSERVVVESRTDESEIRARILAKLGSAKAQGEN